MSVLRTRLLAAWAGALVLTSGPAACTAAPPAAPRSTPLEWRSVPFPVPSGQRAVIGDVAVCTDRWFAVGGLIGADGASTPAAWTSRHGGDWTPLPVRPVSFYGRLTVFSAVACRSGAGGTGGVDGTGNVDGTGGIDGTGNVRVVAVGAASGGVHGNPRTATWRGDSTGLDEVPAPFELYGGPNAVTVGRMAVGPAGVLVVGDRVSPGTSLAGAAAWTSPDGGTFTLVDSDPALGSDAAASTSAGDATAVPGGWLMVGSVLPRAAPHAARDPGAWYSTDGLRWRRESIGGSVSDDEVLERVTPWRGDALAVGVRGSRFGGWLRNGAHWRPGGGFGHFSSAALPAITGLTATPGSVYVAGCDGATYRVWRSADGYGWRELPLPFAMSAGAHRRLLVAADGGRLLMVADDGAGARMWSAADRS